MTSAELEQLSPVELLLEAQRLLARVHDLEDDIRNAQITAQLMDEVAMRYRDCWRRHAKMEPQSSRDIPNN